jgi:hypothetical protein
MAKKNAGGGSVAEHDIRALFSQMQQWLAAGRKPEAVGRDGFSLFADDPLATGHRLLNAYLDELPRTINSDNIKLKRLKAGQTLLQLGDQERLRALRAIMVRVLLGCDQEARQQRQMAQQQQGMSYQQRMDHILNAIVGRSNEEKPMDSGVFGPLVREFLHSRLPLSSRWSNAKPRKGNSLR